MRVTSKIFKPTPAHGWELVSRGLRVLGRRASKGTLMMEFRTCGVCTGFEVMGFSFFLSLPRALADSRHAGHYMVHAEEELPLKSSRRQKPNCKNTQRKHIQAAQRLCVLCVEQLSLSLSHGLAPWLRSLPVIGFRAARSPRNLES